MDCLCAGILFADIACSPIPRLPHAGELIPTKHIQLALGGCASNTAVDLAKLGFRVGVSGCVGDDPFGRVIVETLESAGVDTAGVHQIGGVGSAATMIINVQGEDRRFISTAGANTLFTVDHIPKEWVTRAKVFYVGGYLMMPGLETPEMVDLFRLARQHGAKTVLDVVLFGRQDYEKNLARILPETDVFLPNDDESEIITGIKDPVAQAEHFRHLGAKTVVITMGEKGAVLVSDGVRVRAGIYPVEFVGGAGAGDAFDAGFIAGILLGEDPIGCLRWGSALGASCVRAIGTTESVFNREEAEEFIRTHHLEIEHL